MLDMSKIEAGRYELLLEPFDIGASIRSCEAMLALQAKGKGVTLTSRIQRGLDEVVADQRAIQQILINLVGNAVKFTDAGGAVNVDAAVRDGILQISVSDTGIGIPADRLESLGQPFMQVQNDYTRRYEGTGLGLSLVKGLVALHGGHFAIASVPGDGTIITISIAADGSGAGAAHAEKDGAVDFPPRLKIAATNVAGLEEGLFDGRAQAKIAEGKERPAAAEPASHRGCRPRRRGHDGRIPRSGGVIARNPSVAGGTTAFVVIFSFVAANALWYQPGTHPHPFFRTRDVPAPFSIGRPAVEEPHPRRRHDLQDRTSGRGGRCLDHQCDAAGCSTRPRAQSAGHGHPEGAHPPRPL